MRTEGGAVAWVGSRSGRRCAPPPRLPDAQRLSSATPLPPRSKLQTQAITPPPVERVSVVDGAGEVVAVNAWPLHPHHRNSVTYLTSIASVAQPRAASQAVTGVVDMRVDGSVGSPGDPTANATPGRLHRNLRGRMSSSPYREALGAQ